MSVLRVGSRSSGTGQPASSKLACDGLLHAHLWRATAAAATTTTSVGGAPAGLAAGRRA